MKPHILAVAIWALATGVTSCASGPYHVQTAIRFRYPAIDIYGPGAKSWTVVDVRQIVELARARTDIEKPLDQIEVYRADRAYVKSGNPQNQGDPLTTFEVQRQNGRWFIIPTTVSTGPAIISIHEFP